MRYIINNGHAEYIQKNGLIAFEDLYNPEEVTLLNTLLQNTQLRHSPADNPLLLGYDLHRDDPSLLKAMHFARLIQIASPLFQKKRLRIAFTQYPPSYKTGQTVRDISSFSDMPGALIVNLYAKPNEDAPYLPQSIGSGSFIKPDLALDLTLLDEGYLLIVFAGDRSLYIKQEIDPNQHQLKKLGYSYGDRITHDTHPLRSS